MECDVKTVKSSSTQDYVKEEVILRDFLKVTTYICQRAAYQWSFKVITVLQKFNFIVAMMRDLHLSGATTTDRTTVCSGLHKELL